MQNTDNFDLKIYEGEDLFNPLVVENANAQAIDTQMKKNENHTVGDATELVSGTVHALTRLTPDTPMLRFTATSRFTAGDTFTVDGVQVSALTVSGEQLPDGAYIIGSEVLAYLKGTLLTFFTSQGTIATAQNALKLGGNTPEYYATATAVQQAQDTATAAGNLANEVNSNLNQVSNSLVWKFHKQVSGTEVINLPTVPYNELKFITIFEFHNVQYVFPTHISRIEIENNGDYHRFYLNGEYSANLYTDYRLAVTSKIATLNTLIVNGETFTNNCVTICYYR